MDFMSILFFAIAGIWLVIAFLYFCLIMVYIKMRSYGHFLGYRYNDDRFGRIYIYQQYYIPLGCLLRAYIQFFESDENSYADESNGRNTMNNSSSSGLRANRRTMTRQERRAAMERILRRNTKKTEENCRQPKTPSSVVSKFSSLVCFLKYTSSQSTQYGKPKVAAKIADNSDILRPAQSPETSEDDTDGRRSDSNDEISVRTSDVLICCICLSEYGENPATHGNLEINDMIDPSLTNKYQSTCCMHHFHHGCILSWLQRPSKTDCPCCRSNLVLEDDVCKTVLQIRQEKRKLNKQEKLELKRLSRRVSKKTINEHSPPNATHHPSQSLEHSLEV
jgi:Anaphase-promoting complex subunit 11 RING-H2 finger